MSQLDDLGRLYALLQTARERLSGYRYLRDRQADVPKQGVYFFFDHREPRTAGVGLRVVRVGTHGVSVGSKATLRQRLAQHRGYLTGANAGGGNHRGSVFRRHVGTALLAADGAPDYVVGGWGVTLSPGLRPSVTERELEQRVSTYIRALPLLWVAVPGESGPNNSRAAIERNAIALLAESATIDPPSREWLGHSSPEPKIKSSGLWNVNYVGDSYSPSFLDTLSNVVTSSEMGP